MKLNNKQEMPASNGRFGASGGDSAGGQKQKTTKRHENCG